VGFRSLHPVRADGTPVDATFDVAAVPVFELTYHFKSGARGSPRAVNSDYHEGLELLLRRLGTIGATILGISVDSAAARELEPHQRELDLEFPLDLQASTDAANLRRTITRAQKPVARRPDARPGGGNDQKTIRITIAVDLANVDIEALKKLLVSG
jgi:hypothetical protein